MQVAKSKSKHDVLLRSERDSYLLVSRAEVWPTILILLKSLIWRT